MVRRRNSGPPKTQCHCSLLPPVQHIAVHRDMVQVAKAHPGDGVAWVVTAPCNCAVNPADVCMQSFDLSSRSQNHDACKLSASV